LTGRASHPTVDHEISRAMHRRPLLLGS
jgi:hypothetical protein